jgi:hypothetical protein
MLYREIIAVCSEIHTKHINTLCGQNVEFLIVKPDHGCRIFPKIYDHLKILDARMVTRSKFHTEDPQTLDATAQNIIDRATWICAPLSPVVHTVTTRL